MTGPATVAVEDGVITSVAYEDEAAAAAADVVLPDGVLTAGLVDIQINGAFGVDFAAASDAQWDLVAAKLPATGVTSFQPTYITAPLDDLVPGIAVAHAARRRQE